MEQESIRQLQDEAIDAYERFSQPEASQCAQVVMLAEIALQLAKLNEQLDSLNHWTQLIVHWTEEKVMS